MTLNLGRLGNSQPRAELRGTSQSLGCSAPIFCQGRRPPRMSGDAIPGWHWHQPARQLESSCTCAAPPPSLVAGVLSPRGSRLLQCIYWLALPKPQPANPDISLPRHFVLASCRSAPGALADVFLNAGVFALVCGATLAHAIHVDAVPCVITTMSR